MQSWPSEGEKKRATNNKARDVYDYGMSSKEMLAKRMNEYICCLHDE